MTESLFPELVAKYYEQVVGSVVERFNGNTEEPLPLFKKMLSNEYSADLAWGSTTINNTIVAADVVAMDSSIPLKKRGAITSASGKLPKLAIKYRKGEKEISELNIMAARGASESTIASKFLNDVPRIISGIDTRIEAMFLSALSSGCMLVDDEHNDGLGVRVKFYDSDAAKNKNVVAATVAWTTPETATPIDDLQTLIDTASANGDQIKVVLMSKDYFNNLRKTKQGKQFYAAYNGHTYTSNTVLPVPPREAFRLALNSEFGADFRLVDGTFKRQTLDGKTESEQAWTANSVVALTDEKCGRLVYGTLAEETNPVACVDYQKAGDYCLISKYSNTDPLEEVTAGQALCLPVLDGVDSIYLLKA